MLLWRAILSICTVTSVTCVYKDIVFVLDKSASLSSSELDESLRFIHGVIQSLDIGTSDTLASLVTFATTPSEEFDLKDYTRKSELLSGIDSLLGSSTSGEGDIAGALDFVWDNTFQTTPSTRTSPDPERAVILVTSSTSSNIMDSIAAADKIRTDYSADVFTIGVGSTVYTQNAELRGVASDPDANFTHFVDNFTDLWCAVPILVTKLDPSSTDSPYTNCTLKPLPPIPTSTTEALITTTYSPTTMPDTTTIVTTPGTTSLLSSTTTVSPITTITTTSSSITATTTTSSSATTTTTTAGTTTTTTVTSPFSTISTTPYYRTTVEITTSAYSQSSSTLLTSSPLSSALFQSTTTQQTSTTGQNPEPAKSLASSESSGKGSGSAGIVAGAVVAILTAAAGAFILVAIIRRRLLSPKNEESPILAMVRQYKPAPIGPSKTAFTYQKF